MKKTTFVILQLVLAILLIVFGLLIEFNGKNSADGVSIMLFTVPGVTMLVACIIDGIKYKKPFIFPLIVFIFSVILDIVFISAYKLKLSNWTYFLLFVLVDIITMAICELFYLIVVFNKRRI